MKPILISILVLCALATTAQNQETLLLWPTDKFGKTDVEYQVPQIDDVLRISKVNKPALVVFEPEKSNGFGAGIIVCPGGGYNILAIDKEGYEIAEWLNGLGYTAFVLQYAVPKKRNEAFNDIQRAIRMVRSKADTYKLNSDKIGVLGFSAGGHLSARIATDFNVDSYTKIDAVDELSSRPNFSMLIYPAYLDKGDDRKVSPEIKIDDLTPPFFLFATADDHYSNSALVMSAALRDKKIPVDIHMLREGGHGYGLRNGNLAAETWPSLAESWLDRTVGTNYLAQYESQLDFSKTKVEPLNAVQVIGSHNSYKKAIEKPLWEYLFQLDSAKAISLQYEHPTLIEQLNLGLRNLEMDVFHDPMGGYFTNPKGLGTVQQMGETPLPFDPNEKLKVPGLKMFHIQEVDFRSHHLVFKDGLRAIKKWSDDNLGHTPIFVLINAKDKEVPQTRKPFAFTAKALDSLDMEIRSVFSNDKLITPDLVRGNFSSLEEAVLTKGWPKLENVKGRFLFVLDENKTKIDRYLENYPKLVNAALFVNKKEGNPEAGFRIVNNPIKDLEYIKELVSNGYMVRTRADAGTKEARANDYERFKKAKASGAQVISTDYYVPTNLFPSKFQIIFEEGTYERIKTKK